MALNPMKIRHRQKVLGLPIGPKRTDWTKVGQLGAAATAAGAAAAGATTGVRRIAGRAIDGVKETKDKIDEVADKGSHLADTSSEVADQANAKTNALTSAVSGAGSTIGKVRAAVSALGASGDEEGAEGTSSENLKKARLMIQEQIDVGVDRHTAYNQWTQFEDFPEIVRGVRSVSQDEDESTTWRGKMLGVDRQWTAEIIEQVPDERIVWETRDGVEQRGVVTFHEIGDNLTRIMLDMEYRPHGFVEKFGNLFLTARHRARKDLRLFRHHLDMTGEATGAWRGEIEDGETVSDDEQPEAETDEQPEAETDEHPEAEADEEPEAEAEETSGSKGKATSRQGEDMKKAS